MKISKIFAGLSAAAIMASMAAAVPASAKEIDIYNLGFNIQVGHCKNSRLTIKVTSSKDNIWDWENKTATNEGYMYTVQKSWSQDAPSDDELGDVYGDLNEDGSFKQAKGATILNNWECGPSKYQGQWAQITLTDDDLSALTFEVTFDGSDSTWEYHPYDPSKSHEQQNYETFIFVGGAVSGDGGIESRYDTDGNATSEYAGKADIDEINSQFGGVTSAQATDDAAKKAAVEAAEAAGVKENGFYPASYTATYTFSGSDVAAASPEVANYKTDDGQEEESSSASDSSKADDSKGDNSSSGDSNSKADTSSAAADGSSASDTSSAADTVDAGSTDTANAGNSDSSSTAAASASSSSSTAAASADSKSSTSSTAASATKSSTTTTTTSSNAAAPAGGGSDGSAESDATSNAASGAAAGVGLAITAVAAAAIVVSKRRD